MAGNRYVIDTSVLVRWYIGQSGYLAARTYRDEYLAGKIELQTVECARFELPWVLRKHGLLPGHLSRATYLAAARTVDDFGIPVAPLTADDVEACAALSADHAVSFFDAVFVYHALTDGAGLLTADGGQASVAESLNIEVSFVNG